MWKGKFAKSDQGSNCNQGKQINKYEYGKGRYYNEYYNYDLDLVTTDDSSWSGESEAKSHNDSVPHEILFAKKKAFWYPQKNYQHNLIYNNILNYDNLIYNTILNYSTKINIFTVCKFCNNSIQVEEDKDKSVGLASFLKIVCQNQKHLKSKINSLVNMSNKNGQFFEIN